jgi:translation initiation factor 2 subunit 2
MSVDDYESMLGKASDILAKTTVNQERLKIPRGTLMEEGKVTVVRNFMDIMEIINRDPKDVSKFLTKELGIGITTDGKRLLINRRISEEDFNNKMEQYLNVYVRCYECNSPDTEIIREARVSLIACKACGAQHPINMSREIMIDRDEVRENKKYTVTIDSIGKSGEGRVLLFGTQIIVPGVKKGQQVKVLVKKIRGGTAIAEVVKD